MTTSKLVVDCCTFFLIHDFSLLDIGGCSGGSFCLASVEMFKVVGCDGFLVRRSVGRFFIFCCDSCKHGDHLGRQTLLHIICTKFVRATDVKSGLLFVGMHGNEKSVGAVSMLKSGKLSWSVLL